MHNPTSDGRWTSAPMGAMGLAKWHRLTVADGHYADYRPHRWPMGIARMGLRGRWERPDGRPAAQRPVPADCSTAFGTRLGGSLMSWHAVGAAAAGWGSGSAARLAHTRRPVHRVRAARLPRQAGARPWHARSSGAGAAAAAAAAAAGAPEEPRAPGARHPSPGHAHGPWDASAHGSGSGSATSLAQANFSGSTTQSVARTDVSR